MTIIVTSLAQTVVSKRFKTISIDQGLSQGYVSGITQDKKGLMWFTTTDGLNKYDGYSCTIFHHDLEDSTSIGSDDLTCVFEDSSERLWVGTRNNGLDLFDRASRSFKHFRTKETNSLSSDKVLDIKEDQSGILWIRTASGIDRLQLTTNTKTGETKYTFTSIIKQKDNAGAEGIFIDSRNRIFITTTTKVLEYISSDPKGGFRLEERFTFPSAIPFFIPSLLEDTINHNLLLNAQDIIRFPDYNFNYPQYLYHSQRTDISWTIDKQNNLWLGGINGIIQLDLNNDILRKVISDDPAQMKVINAPTHFYTDRTGIVWMGSGGHGVIKHDPEIEKFTHLLPGESVYQLLESQPGKILCNDFTEINVNALQSRTYDSDAVIQKKQLTFPNGAPITLSKDSSGNIWYGINLKLVRFNPHTLLNTEIKIPYTDVLSLPFPVYTDRENNVWLGYKNWLVRYNINSGEFSRYEYPTTQVYYEYDFLQSIYDDDGFIWLGTVNGLFYFEKDKNLIRKAYLFNPIDTTSISNNFILSVSGDINEPGHYLWVGTKGGGLNRLNKFTGKFERFTTKNGLPNNVIYGIVPDYAHNLWLSTNKGLSAFNIPSKSFRNFDVSDGLQSNEFNRYGYCRTTKGLIAFAGMNGVTLFNPAQLQALPSPDVVLTEFRLFNQPVNPGISDSPLPHDIDFISKLELRYEQNVITLRFAATDYRRPSAIQYRYKMNGFDENWIYAGSTHEATYTNLDPGEYHFLVEASYDRHNWNGQPKSLILHVLAPWWQTWWFKMFIIIGTVSVAYAIYRYRIHQLMVLESLRNRIARDLHDEVGSSISTIAIYSKIMHEQMENKTFNNDTLLQKISDHATEIMESMTDIIWNINSKNDAFDSIINRMREHAFQLLEAKGYELHFDFDKNLYQLQLPMDKRRDFYLIYKEVLNNIAKYAEGKNVWIKLSLFETRITLMIQDDGKGFDINAPRKGKGGNGLTNIEQRAGMLNGKLSVISLVGKGTTVQLDF